jgi:hypothetical protein
MKAHRICSTACSYFHDLHISDMAGPGQHILAYAVSCGVFLKILLINNSHINQEMKQGISASVVSIFEHAVSGTVHSFQRWL